MKVAGLHFGHDASGAVVDATGITSFLNKERRTRVKHALGLSPSDVRELVCDLPEDTLVGLSSTQQIPIFFEEALRVEIESGFECSYSKFHGLIGSDSTYVKYMSWRPNNPEVQGVAVSEDDFLYLSRLNEGFNHSYSTLGMVAGQFAGAPKHMHRDARLIIDGRSIRSRFYNHHYLHAYYAAYAVCSDKPAIVITGDGGIGPNFHGGGIYFWTPGKKLLQVTPIDGWIGQFYSRVGEWLGLDAAGSPGKLMGLSPYGRPIYFDQSLVGTRFEVTDGYSRDVHGMIAQWLGKFGIQAADIPKWDTFGSTPPPLVADIAASAQLILEMNMLELARAARQIARRAAFNYEVVALAGGVALNCPANSNLAVTLGLPVLVPPAVNDEGLSIGAAVAAYFDANGEDPAPAPTFAESVYLGADISNSEVVAAASSHAWRRLDVEDKAAAVVDLLLKDEAVGVCYGRSEVGPRALGHRSMLVNAASPSTWAAANAIKRRELWRPFAPAVLKEDSSIYFDRGPEDSYFMLFNYRCNSKMLPAVTHYDHSSRIQQVTKDTGILYDVLVDLKARGLPPFVLNTSFNGPGTPIVETAEDAFAEAGKLGMKYILTEYGLYAAASVAE